MTHNPVRDAQAWVLCAPRCPAVRQRPPSLSMQGAVCPGTVFRASPHKQSVITQWGSNSNQLAWESPSSVKALASFHGVSVYLPPWPTQRGNWGGMGRAGAKSGSSEGTEEPSHTIVGL